MISIRDFTKEEILHVLETAKEFEQNRVQNFLEGKVIASLFFEPSTRTRLSFETAINRLGAKVIGFSDASNTSQSKGETLKDTIKMVSNYVDMIVMRHPLEGSSRYASEEASVPVVNAGDGANQHPSQTLLDLYSILQTQGTLEGLTINMVGDLKYGRTTHSLLQAMSHFHPKFIFTAPEELKMPKEYKEFLDSKGIEYIETTSLDDYLNECTAKATGLPVYAGPVEGTAIGNLLAQAMALGAVKDIDDLRRVVRNSEDVNEFTPNHTPEWEEAYQKLLKLI